MIAGDESANAILITLSENLRNQVWIAEIVQGNASRTVLVLAGSIETESKQGQASVLLQTSRLISTPSRSSPEGGVASGSSVLAVKADDAGAVMLQADRVSFYSAIGSGLSLMQAQPVPHMQTIPRDARGQLVLDMDGIRFSAYLPGIACEGTRPSRNGIESTIHCKASDDPWPLAGSASNDRATLEVGKVAFYNGSRNFYTGVIKPSLNFELPRFYDAAELPRANGEVLLVSETTGAVELIEGMARRSISGVRDWGSDFAVLHTQCGVDSVVLVSSSGEAVRDSLRAYSIPAQEAIAASAPLAVDGTVTAITSLTPVSAAVVVRKQDTTGSYHDEVLRVSTLCN